MALVSNQGEASQHCSLTIVCNEAQPRSVDKGLHVKTLAILAMRQIGPCLPTEIFSAMLWVETLNSRETLEKHRLENRGLYSLKVYWENV